MTDDDMASWTDDVASGAASFLVMGWVKLVLTWMIERLPVLHRVARNGAGPRSHSHCGRVWNAE